MFHDEKITYYLATAIVSLGMAMGLAGCSEDDSIPEGPVATDQPTYITLTLDVGSAGASNTRGLTYDDEPATDEENYINPEDLFLYFFPCDATEPTWDGWTVNSTSAPSNWSKWGNTQCIVAKLAPDSFTRLSGTGSEYSVTFRLETGNALLSKTEFRIFVIANWRKRKVDIASGISNPIYANMGYLELDATCQYDYPDVYGTGATSFTPSKESPIPMCGVKTVKDVKFVQGRRTNLGTINLVRAMAKVEVKLTVDNSTSTTKADTDEADATTSDNQVSISKVKIDKCARKGMCPPKAMWIDTDTNLDNYDRYISIPYEHLSTSYTFSTYEAEFQKVAENDFLFYMPEYRQIGHSFNGLSYDKNFGNNKLTVTINDEDYELEFKDYDTNKYFNILRNHHYVYNLIWTPGARLKIQYEVLPWDEKTADDIIFE